MSSTEACWRLFQFPMHEQSHSIYRLSVHLPNEQTVYFNNDNPGAALDRADRTSTTLNAWFELNKINNNAREFLYIDIPYHFTWVPSGTYWKPRERGSHKIISRIYNVSPNNQELFFLRTLLFHVRGAKSFDEIKTYNNIRYETFKEAARARGLLDNDDEAEKCLLEAVNYQMPKQMRQLFYIICIYNRPNSPSDLWDKFKTNLFEDFKHKYPNQSDDIYNNLALADLNQFFLNDFKSNSDFGLPMPNVDLIRIFLTREESMYTQSVYSSDENAKLATERIKMLNKDQKMVYDEIIEAITNKKLKSNCFYLNGSGGIVYFNKLNIGLLFICQSCKIIGNTSLTYSKLLPF